MADNTSEQKKAGHPSSSASQSSLKHPIEGAIASEIQLSTSSQTYPSSHFVLSAGSVLFRHDPTTRCLQICLVHHTKRGWWILPKGRKDQHEDMATTAIRETHEETGYPCELFPCVMPTRAPAPGANLDPWTILQGEEAICEPFAVTTRNLKDGSLKMIWWYLSWLKEGCEGEKGERTYVGAGEEGYESRWCDIEEALEIMKGSEAFEDVVKRAVGLVQRQLEVNARK
ncbi:NUDIX hydrolase domain-like protein, partial [Coprinopsis sp. MPI-PUGE-AT-0042]